MSSISCPEYLHAKPEGISLVFARFRDWKGSNRDDVFYLPAFRDCETSIVNISNCFSEGTKDWRG